MRRLLHGYARLLNVLLGISVALLVVRMIRSTVRFCGAPLVTPVARSRRLGIARFPLLGSSSRA